MRRNISSQPSNGYCSFTFGVYYSAFLPAQIIAFLLAIQSARYRRTGIFQRCL